jgi:circadian clock protein KaiC
MGEPLSSGVDAMLHGGLERGTSTIVSGPTGAGKTTLGTQFVKEAATRGERSSTYLFEETQDTFLARNEAIGTPIGKMLDEDTLEVQELDALEASPEQLGQMMRQDIEAGTEILMIDGIDGYRVSAGDDPSSLLPQLHPLVRYIKNQGVSVILVAELADVGTGFNATQGHVSDLADSSVTLRHIELDGQPRTAIGVLKKRVWDFEPELRQLRITENGIQIGDRLTGLRGVLTGTPEIDRDGRDSGVGDG